MPESFEGKRAALVASYWRDGFFLRDLQTGVIRILPQAEYNAYADSVQNAIKELGYEDGEIAYVGGFEIEYRGEDSEIYPPLLTDT